MKKFLFLAALASVALASCVSDESPAIDSTPGDKPITFNSPVLYGHTRAQSGEIEGTYPQGESFNVYAVWSSGDFAGWEATGAQWYMGNATTDKEGIKVTFKSTTDDITPGTGAWEPATAYYWPKNGKLTFAAYSPSDANASADFSYGAAGLTIENFAIPGTAANQYDLMFSKRTYNKTTSTDGTNTTYDGVDITFKHALSSIKFKVKLYEDYPGTEIKVKKISVYNVEQKGKFEEKILEATPGTYTSNPQWTITTDKVLEANAYVPFSGEQSVTTTTETELIGDEDLILMPQVFHDGSTEQNTDYNVKVEYTIKSASSDEIAQTHVQKLSEIKTDGSVSSWLIGKRYTYTIIFSLQQIYFAPSVENWENVIPGNINI